MVSKIKNSETGPQKETARSGEARARRLPSAKRRPASGATRNTAVVKERSGRSFFWLNRLLIVLATAIVLTAATKGFLMVQSLPVQRISVTGELEHTQAQVVQDIVQQSLAGGFLKADLQQIQRQLENLPWIYEATVRRRWPAALEIHILEELPIARWGQDGFLNHEGEVFHTDKRGDWNSLPLLKGPEGSAQSLMAKYQRLVEFLRPLGLHVDQLLVDERGQLDAVMAGGMQLTLGAEDFLGRMHRFEEVYRSELIARRAEVEKVDLRYKNGVAVTFSETSQLAEL
ncbi:MAG: cell division protein FtsQ/DivIB [Halioglobus sp.]